MKNLAQCLRNHLPVSASLLVSLFISATLVSSALAAGAVPALAQTGSRSSSPATRISAEIGVAERTPLPGSQHPLAQTQFESGRVAAGTRLQGVSMYFSRTQSQEVDLQKLLAAQQNPSSRQYHQWLTPEQFASRFGMADADITKVRNWLEQQGFSVDSVARGKDMIRFTGTVGQVEAAFATEMHNYTVHGAKHFAPSTALTVPSALAGIVQGIRNLDDFRPKAHVVANRTRRLKPSFTSGGTGFVFFAPGDITTVYDVQKMYNAGFMGTGQSIAIVGQSAISTSDIEAFQSAASLTIKDPTQILMPGTGTPQIFTGDEVESDLDLEWSGAMAPGATIYFVYTGSDTSYGTFDALVYAIDNQIANVVSSSYGLCEAELDGQTQTVMEAALAQAAAQGQTVISASGDSGSTDCFQSNQITNPSLSAQEALAVDYPASSQYVTGLGGTEISTSNANYLTPGDGYWLSPNGSDQIVSAVQYIPEMVWNEDLANCGTDDCLDSGGGGASTLFTKPSWQTALTPTDGKRDVPDISLNAATALPGYLFCTSDTSFWSSGQVASCNSGFRDATSGLLTTAGGTSFAAPIFAGMLALINEDKGYTTGQGLINPTLYSLASNVTTYASAFHDITSGNNKCLAGSSYCNGTPGFSAGNGYDEASGLGSLDLFNLATAWPASSTTPVLIDTTTSIAASNTAPQVNTSVTFTIAVAAVTGTTMPTGNVTITVDSDTPVTGLALSNGTLSYPVTFTTAGTHQIIAHYLGDSTYVASTGSATVNVAGTSSGTGSFKLAATNVTVSQGSTASSTITVTPAGGYTGTVEITFDTSNDNALQNLCYEFTNTLSNGDGSVSVGGTAAVTTQLTFDTNAADCISTGAVRKGGKHAFRSMHKTSSNSNTRGDELKATSATIAFAGLLLAGFMGRSSRRLRGLACLMLLGAIGMAVTACGGGGNSNTVSNPPKGTYTVSLSGSDTNSTSIPAATTSFTFTIQ